MNTWPRMESKAIISKDFFFSKDFLDNYGDYTRQKLSELEGKELTVCGMSVYKEDRTVFVTLDDENCYCVPIGFIDPVDPADIVEEENKDLPYIAEPIRMAPVKNQMNFVIDDKNDRMTLAMILFANGYKVWTDTIIDMHKGEADLVCVEERYGKD